MAVYRKKLVDKDGNTIIPAVGDIYGTVYNATLSTATAGDTARYDFTPDTPVENNKVYAVKFPAPTVNNATIILGDGVVSGSILVPPVSATDSPNYELLTTDMINDTEPLLLMYNGVQWVCLNQKNKVATSDLNDSAVTSAKISWATFAPSSWTTLNKTYGCYYAKYGNIVFLSVLFRDVAATSAALGTLRADCLPTHEIGVRNAYDNQQGLLYITTDGKVIIQWTGTAPSYFFATAVYPVDK